MLRGNFRHQSVQGARHLHRHHQRSSFSAPGDHGSPGAGGPRTGGGAGRLMDNISKGLGEYIAGARFEDLSAEAVAAAKRSTLDTLGAMLAGSTAPGIDTVVRLAKGWGGVPEAHVVGFGTHLPAPLAAWCNGTMARALEIDDCVDFLPVHPSASAVPALLTLAELRPGLSGQDYLIALAVGQDVKIRMGL